MPDLDPPPPPPPDPDPTPTESSSAVPGGVGTVEVTVLVDGSPAPLCHVRVASGVYDEVGLFVDPTADPLVFTDVPETTSGLLQTYCYPTLYPGCVAAWSSTWPGGSYGGAMPENGAPFGPLTVIAGETTEVVLDITCAPVSGSPPPPPTTSSPPPACCPPVPWCLKGGGWDTFPVGVRPDGVTTLMRSEAIAERDCPPGPPPTPVYAFCPDACDTPFLAPDGSLTFSFVNQTPPFFLYQFEQYRVVPEIASGGDYPFQFGQGWSPYDPSGPSAIDYSTSPPTRIILPILLWARCQPDGSLLLGVSINFAHELGADSSNLPWLTAFENFQNGWNVDTIGFPIATRTLACGEQIDWTVPHMVCTVRWRHGFTLGGFEGTFDLYVGG